MRFDFFLVAVGEGASQVD